MGWINIKWLSWSKLESNRVFVSKCIHVYYFKIQIKFKVTKDIHNIFTHTNLLTLNLKEHYSSSISTWAFALAPSFTAVARSMFCSPFNRSRINSAIAFWVRLSSLAILFSMSLFRSQSGFLGANVFKS